MFKCGFVVGGLAAATFLGTFAAGPALASTGSSHRIPVVIHEAALSGATQPDSGAPGGLPLLGALGQQASSLPSALAPLQTASGDGIVPGVNNAVGSLLSGLGLTDLSALVSGSSATHLLGGPSGGLGGLLSSLNGSNGLPDLSKLLNGQNGQPDLGKLLGGLGSSNGLPDLGKLLNGQNGQPDLGKLVGLLVIGKVLGGLGGLNPLANPLDGSNGLGALSALGNLLNGAKPAIGG